MKYAFMATHSAQFRIASMSRVFKVSRSGYYEWRDRPPSAHALADQTLMTRIRHMHVANHEAYGAVKTWKALNQQGVPCGKHRVARLRREGDMEARRKRRFRVTVEHHKMPELPPDRLKRHFHVDEPNRAWVGDVTFIRTRAGWLFLAMLLDLYSRKIVGWAMSDRNDEALTLAALEMALTHRAPAPGCIHHSDQGGLYRSRNYRARMEQIEMLPSMGNKGTAYDNAVAESFFSNLKNELTHHCTFITREDARAAIFSYIELFYNRQRIHQTLGYRSPQYFEEQMVCPL
ncbi:MAG: IS3 family transposase [Rhodocyclaceae bacterium]|nr:IS3 family transposase [Rhodocyclaceae bacterium]